MKHNRQLIHGHKLDPNELKANVFNKAKMWMQMTGVVMLAATPKNKRSWRRAGLGVTAAGTLTGEIGERIFRRKVARLIDKKQASQDLPSAA